MLEHEPSASASGETQEPQGESIPPCPAAERSEEELAAAALAGDQTSLEQLLLRYYDRLLNYIRQQMPARSTGRAGPEDILQHTYLKAFRSVGGFEPRSGYSFFSWLKRIADNERVDHFRKSNREQPNGPAGPANGDSVYGGIAGQLAGDDPTATVLARRRELIRVLHVTLAGMKPTHRRVIELYHLEGRPLEDVAAELQLTDGQVRGLLHRARGSLRDAIRRLSHFV